MRFARCLAEAVVPLALAVAAVAQPIASKLGPNVAARLDADGAAEVFVLLAEPPVVAGAASPYSVQARQRAVTSQRAAVLSSLSADEIQVHRTLSLATAFSASVTAGGLAKLLADPSVLHVDAPQWGSGALSESMALIRANVAHHRDALGQGVTVAVLDTGVDPTNPDLAGSIAGEHCICSGGCCPDGSREQMGQGSAFTSFVHGIHVTGIIVSKGIMAPEGVAPLAKVVAVKVLDDFNRGLLVDWIAALDWIATQRPDVQAINMSLVSDRVYAGECDHADSYTVAFAQEMRALRARGVLTFVASGNNGQAAAMADPACISAAVAVGATTDSDGVWSLTNRDAKLGLLAPGVGILSTGPGQTVATLSGTSMAAPHVTGTAALLLGLDPTLDADTLEAILRDTGVPVADPRTGLTRPRINVLAAMNAVDRVSRPVRGGGSRRTDCLAEWNFSSATTMVMQPLPTATCRDGDPSCDADALADQCTFPLSVCFNVDDRRLPHCTTGAPITGYRFSSPSASPSHDEFESANARALADALPVLPIVDANRCTDTVPFVVPAGSTKWIRFTTQAADGRRDADRLRFTCLRAG